MTLFDALLMASGIFAGFVCYVSGRTVGVTRERSRCRGLVAQSWQQDGGSLSPTARRIYHSIEKGHVQLVTVDGFFGKEPKP